MTHRIVRGVRVGLAFGLAIVGLISVTGLNGDGAVDAAVSSISDVTVADFFFTPRVVTITTGSSVRWTNNGAFVHTSTSDAGLWNSGDLSGLGGQFIRTFSAPGVYGYYCIYHGNPIGGGMAGVVVVVSSTLDVCPTCTYTTIGPALAAANNGDLIRVASGAYAERLTITKTVALEGGWNASFTARTPGDSVVDAQRLGRVMTVLGVVSPTIDGFTITGGDATSEVNAPTWGGGVYIEDGGALLANNVITNNVARVTAFITETGYGGGVFVESGSVVISANQIMSNVASMGVAGEGYGGGVYARGAPTLIDNMFVSNRARSGSLYGYGGGADVRNGVVRSNRFISNSASNGGGVALIVDTIFENNLSRGTVGGNFLVQSGGFSRLANNFLLESNCPFGMYPGGGNAIPVVNNTIVGCSIGVYVPVNASPPISNNLFYSNTTAIVAEGTPLLDYNGFWMNGANFNVLTSTLTGTHNVFSNPLFVDPAAGDYHLSFGSPMINAGTSAGAPSTDYDGDPRPTGSGFDIGADEFVPTYGVFLPVVLKSAGP